MLWRVFIARLHIDPQHQTKVRHQVGVVAVRRPTGFVRIVTHHHRAFLAAIQRLDRAIDVQHPRLYAPAAAGRNSRDASAATLGPPSSRRSSPSPRRTASSLTTFFMPSSRGFTASHRSGRNVGIAGNGPTAPTAAPVPSKSRLLGAFGLLKVSEAICHTPAGEQSRLLYIIDEEWQLAQRRHKSVAVPLDAHPTGKGVRGRRPLFYRWLFTRRVRRKHWQRCVHPLLFCRFGPNRNHPTAGFRIKGLPHAEEGSGEAGARLEARTLSMRQDFARSLRFVCLRLL